MKPEILTLRKTLISKPCGLFKGTRRSSWRASVIHDRRGSDDGLPNGLIGQTRSGGSFESSTIGIAGVLKQFDTTGKFKNFNAALAESAKAIDLLKEKAKVSPATFEQLVQGFQGLSGAFASAGLKMTEQVNLVVLMSQALAGLGIRSEQLLQESRALVTGNITEDAAAARMLQITKQQIDSAKTQGRLYDFLTEKLGAFAEAGKVGAGSLNTQFSNLEDALTQLKGIATTEVFKELRDDLAKLIEVLNSPGASANAAGFAAALGTVIDAGKLALGFFQTEIGSTLAKVAVTSLPGVGALTSLPNPLAASFRLGQLEKITAEYAKQEIAILDQIVAAGTLEEKEEARKKIAEAIHDVSESEKTSTGDLLEADVRHLAVLLQMEASFDRHAGTKKEAAASDATNAEQRKKDEDTIARVLGTQVELAKAKATGNVALVASLTEQQRIQELLAKLDKDQVQDKALALAVCLDKDDRRNSDDSV